MNEGKAERIRQEIGSELHNACMAIIRLEERTYIKQVTKLAENHINYLEEYISSDEQYNLEMHALIIAIFHYSKKRYPLEWKILINNIGDKFIDIATHDTWESSMEALGS